MDFKYYQFTEFTIVLSLEPLPNPILSIYHPG